MPHSIEEIIYAKDALKHFGYDTLKNTWLVLDLDNTVMESRLDLGSDQWFSALYSHGMKRISDTELAKAAIFVVYHVVQHHIRTQPVESEIPLMIGALQDLGVRVLGLTARGEPIMIPTVRQLKDIGIDLSRNAMEKKASSTYAEGIIFCGGQDKGQALADFLKEVPEQPEHVVMLDDKVKHLDHVSEAMKPLSIDFSGLHYRYLDEKVSQFDMHKANEQLCYLVDHLPPEAQEAIEHLGLLSEMGREKKALDGERHSVAMAHHFFPHPSHSRALRLPDQSPSSDGLRPASATF